MALVRNKILSGAMIVLLLTFSSEFASAQDPILKLEGGKVLAKNLDAEVLYSFSRYFNRQSDWESVFPVRTKTAIDNIAIAGTYEVFKDAVVFTPRFPLAVNVDYVAMFHTEELSRNTNDIYLPKTTMQPLRLEFRLSPASAAPPEITALYPSSGILPENLLKIHLTFSKPMTSGTVYSKLKLFDQENREVEKPFLIVDQELWDNEMKTLTILFDPGRIKRGLRPNLEMKPALRENESYTLVVEEGWEDIDGISTTRRFTKKFRCTVADRESPLLSSYEVHVPAHSKAPLIIDLKEPHDAILLKRYVHVRDFHGDIVEGIVRIGENESSVEFVPKYLWVESKYTIEINPLLEDLAGNNLKRLFDEDITLPSTTNATENRLHFTFSKNAR